MEKVTAFLEKYVEWIAIGIGGLIFMYALWIYWIKPDVRVELTGQEVGPRQVDTMVLRTQGESLESAIQSTRLPPPDVVPPEPPDIVTQALAAFRLDQYNARNLRLTGHWVGPNPLGRPDEQGPIGSLKVTVAPTPPPAIVTRLASGRSYADVPEGDQVSTRDFAEVRVDFAIDTLAIAQAFRAVSLPAVHQNTSVLRVALQRQRLLGSGQWSEVEEVPLLQNNPLAANPLPANGAPVEQKHEYVALAEGDPSIVLQPAFYEVRAGDNPMALEMVIEVPAPGDPTTNPATQQQQQPPSQQQPRGGRLPQPQEQEQAPAAMGAFNASQRQGRIVGWAWDATAIPGETYRYRVVYGLKNPMFNTNGIVDPSKPELESQVAVFSSPQATQWSPPIKVEPLTYFFMTSAGTSQAKFTVFRWQNGGWQSRDFEASPGDYIGAQADGIDYRTGRALVDVREDPANKETYALLVDSEGRFARRSAKDISDPKFKQLQSDVKLATGGVAMP